MICYSIFVRFLSGNIWSLYQPIGGDIEILRVRHGAMDLEDLFDI
jgi:plasmid stabilization system protein ParE